MLIVWRQCAVDAHTVAILPRCGEQRTRCNLDFEATELLSDTDHIDLERQLDPQHKATFWSGDADPAGEVFPYPAGVDLHIALINLAHTTNMSMIMSFAHKGSRCQLRSGNVSSNDGVLHVQQFVVIATGHHPTHAQTGGDGFGKRTAEYYAAVAVPGVDRAGTLWPVRHTHRLQK